MTKRMIFTLLVMDSVGHNFQGIWRHPEARNREYKKFELWVDLAKKAEQAKIDAFFFTESWEYRANSTDLATSSSSRRSTCPIGDCTMLVPALAHETSDIGFLYTSSVISHHPFIFARQVSTLDQLTDGRVGWNIVTSANERAFRNLGLPGNLSHESATSGPRNMSTSSTSSGRAPGMRARSSTTRLVASTPIRRRSTTSTTRASATASRASTSWSPRRNAHRCWRKPVDHRSGLDFASNHAELMFLSAYTPETIAQQITRCAPRPASTADATATSCSCRD